MILPLLIALCSSIGLAQSGKPPIDLWLVTSNPDDAVTRGARMGAEEMNRTATLLGRRFALHEVRPSRAGAVRGFVLLNVDRPGACDLARDFSANQRAVVLTARVANTPCSAPWLQLRLPAARRARAVSEAGTSKALVVDEWHSSLQRFGASELNERYERRTHTAMNGDSWAGWFAVKLAAESALRLDLVDRAALVGPAAPSFDGHKGTPLRFDATGVLQQPVYIIDTVAARVVKEVS